MWVAMARERARRLPRHPRLERSGRRSAQGRDHERQVERLVAQREADVGDRVVRHRVGVRVRLAHPLTVGLGAPGTGSHDALVRGRRDRQLEARPQPRLADRLVRHGAGSRRSWHGRSWASSSAYVGGSGSRIDDDGEREDDRAPVRRTRDRATSWTRSREYGDAEPAVRVRHERRHLRVGLSRRVHRVDAFRVADRSCDPGRFPGADARAHRGAHVPEVHARQRQRAGP